MRCADWEERLLSFLTERRDAPFVWGANDCALFAADAVRVITGVDYALDFRGRYEDALGARRALRARGYRTAPDVVDAYFEEVPGLRAGRGDLVEVATERGPALGVAYGQNGYFPGVTGLVSVPAASCARGWRVV